MLTENEMKAIWALNCHMRFLFLSSSLAETRAVVQQLCRSSQALRTLTLVKANVVDWNDVDLLKKKKTL